MGDLSSVPGGGVAGLARALDVGDGLAARRVVAGLTTAGVATADGRDAVLGLLARRAAAGSLLAVELLAEVVDDLGLARGAVRRFLVDEAAVDDVAQDTLISMVTSIGSFRGEARFTTWLHRIARNRAVDHLRRQRSVEPLGEDDVGEAQRISSVIAARDAAQALVARLPGTYRRAVVLRDVERLPYAEVAERLGLNVNTVKSHVARGRAMLARALVDVGRDR
jgi:RNA polymerase sigma-70 factor (ECF subfamily)